MCTIILTAGKPKNPGRFKSFISRLGFYAELQGRGASGFVLKNKGQDPEWNKDNTSLGNQIQKLNQHLGDDWPELGIFHARSGYGYRKEDDIHHHPFVGENIMLVHEGWISGNYFEFAKRVGVVMKTNTDSEVIMGMIDREDSLQKGIINTFAILPVGSKVGIALFDKRHPDSIFFASLDGRCSDYPLFTTEDETTVMVSSPEMAYEAAAELDYKIDCVHASLPPMHIIEITRKQKVRMEAI